MTASSPDGPWVVRGTWGDDAVAAIDATAGDRCVCSPRKKKASARKVGDAEAEARQAQARTAELAAALETAEREGASLQVKAARLGEEAERLRAELQGRLERSLAAERRQQAEPYS